MPSPAKIAYRTYKKRCKELELSPVDLDHFSGVFKRQVKAIRYMLEKLGRDNPYIVSKIDKNMILYAAVTGGKVVVNSWTTEELKALTGLEVTS